MMANPKYYVLNGMALCAVFVHRRSFWKTCLRVRLREIMMPACIRTIEKLKYFRSLKDIVTF